MDNTGLAQLRAEGAEDGLCIEIEWKKLTKADIQAMRDVVDMIPDWEKKYNRIFSKPSYTATEDGLMDELTLDLLNAYSIRETLNKIDAVNALIA